MNKETSFDGWVCGLYTEISSLKLFFQHSFYEERTQKVFLTLSFFEKRKCAKKVAGMSRCAVFALRKLRKARPLDPRERGAHTE